MTRKLERYSRRSLVRWIADFAILVPIGTGDTPVAPDAPDTRDSALARRQWHPQAPSRACGLAIAYDGTMATRRKFKTITHYHEAGDLHEPTFSCYRQMKLLTNDAWRRYLVRSIDEAGEQFRFQLVAFVIMPEHVHLLLFPLDQEPAIGNYLAAVKRPVSADVKRDLQRAGSPLLKRLTIRERPGKEAFRFWQEGPGYDRNLQKPFTVLGSIDYIHMNPVRRKLVTQARLWKWSSARFYESDGQEIDPDLPRITPMPTEIWS